MDRLRFEQSVTKGQLAALTGVSVPWPNDVPESHTPEAIEALFAKLLEPHADRVAHRDVDCAEYPCVVSLSSHPGAQIPALESSIIQAFEDPALLTQRKIVAFSEGDVETKVLAVLPEGWDNEDTTRVEYRIETLLDAVH